MLLPLFLLQTTADVNMGTKTMHCTLEGPANALAINRDATQVAVAGRNVFKVFSLDNDEFVERMNLRVGKNLNLNFSCSDVVWNVVEDHILATAATNGAVVTWNLNKSTRSKQDIVFQDHKRTVNKVCFHPSEAHILLSGSQDGTMKCFDIRKREAASTFLSSSESVRDVQFCPHHHFVFVAVQENGNVQLWDLRRADKCERQFTAHSGPVFTCDWHPDDRRLLATGGRDKAIKIWDISSKPTLSQCIQTIASVAHIKWRPQRKYHIANSSLVVDCSINIWDTRRPYVPFAAFTEHKDVATGFAWRNDPRVLLSTSKDSTLFQYLVQDAVRPANHANALSVAHMLNASGDVAFASSDRFFGGEQASSTRGRPVHPTSARFPAVFKKAPSMSDQFCQATSSLVVFSNTTIESLLVNWFQESALKYQLTGRPLPDLCESNAAVAADLGRHDVALAWRAVKTLYGSAQAGGMADFLGLASLDAVVRVDADRSSQEGSNFHTSRHNSGNTRNRNHSGSKKLQAVAARHLSGGALDRAPTTPHDPATIHTTTGDDSASSGMEDDLTLTYIASGMVNVPGDFFSEDGDTGGQSLSYNLQMSVGSGGENHQDWQLPNEAFEPRHAIRDSPPVTDLGGHPQSSPPSGDEEDVQDASALCGDMDDQSKVLTVSRPLSLPPWNPSGIVASLLSHYVDQGDVQMAVSIMIALGDKIKGCVDESTQEAWFLSYIDLLSRFEMWNVIARVIALSSVPSVSTLNQQSTVVHTLCSGCSKPLARSGWFCDRCKAVASPCAVCHEVVRGLFVWCQGCAHGGHLQHMTAWFREQRLCPTGCGHPCEYT
ncbi:unnamed protein product [Ixodes persulcatus]